MKATLCDICLTEGTMKTSTWRTIYRSPVRGSLRVDLCGDHKEAMTGIEREKAISLLLKAQKFINRRTS